MLVASLGSGHSGGHGGHLGGQAGAGPLSGAGTTTAGIMSSANSAATASMQGSQLKKCLNEKHRREQVC